MVVSVLQYVYLVQFYEIENVSCKFSIDLFHQKFSNTYVSKETLRKEDTEKNKKINKMIMSKSFYNTFLSKSIFIFFKDKSTFCTKGQVSSKNNCHWAPKLLIKNLTEEVNVTKEFI